MFANVICNGFWLRASGSGWTGSWTRSPHTLTLNSEYYYFVFRGECGWSPVLLLATTTLPSEASAAGAPRGRGGPP